MPEGQLWVLNSSVWARWPVPRGVQTPTVGFVAAAQPSRAPAGSHELATGCTRRQCLPQGFCSRFGGWEGEVSRVCCSWCGVLPALAPGNAFAPLPWCFGAAPAPRNPAGRVWKAGQGRLGEVEAFWAMLGYAGLVSTASQGAALAPSCPFSPGRSIKPSLFSFCFQR